MGFQTEGRGEEQSEREREREDGRWSGEILGSWEFGMRTKEEGLALGPTSA